MAPTARGSRGQMSARQLIAVVRRRDYQLGLGFRQIVGLHGYQKWALNQASSCRALACALLPACPKPPPFLEVFVCDTDSASMRQFSGILRRTGGTPIFFA
jgi:hypothetical protein